MSVKNCLTAKLKSEAIAPHRVKEVVALFDEIEADARASMSPEAARTYADTMVKKLVRQQFELERRQTLLQAATQVRIEKNLSSYRTAKGEHDLAAAMLAHLGPDELAKGVSSLEARHKAVLGLLHARMTGVLKKFRRTTTGGVRNQAEMHNLVREAFGENTGDASARELAKAWSEAAETARARFNAAGGDIGKREDWGLPQAHDALLVRKAGREAWLADIRPRLNISKMPDPVTGQPMTPKRLNEALDAVYDTIISEGWAKIKPSGAQRGKKLANRRADHRFLVFRDAENWLAYNEKFGSRDPFSAMVSHMDGMARDIAMLEVLGPNPTSTLKWMQETVLKAAKTAPGDNTKLDNRAKSAIKKADTMMAVFDGSLNSPVNPQAARVMGDIRNVLTSAQLGAAVLSATNDVALQRIATRMNGLKTSGALGKILKILGDEATQEQLVRAGLVAEDWTQNAIGLQRFHQDFMGGEVSKRIADTVLRVSGLNAWTQAGRFAFGWEFMGALADHASTLYAKLPDPFRRSLDRYGIDAAAWDDIRAVKPYSHKGVSFIRPEDIAASKLQAERAEALATSLLEMIQTEMEFAVPTAVLHARAAIGGVTGRPGTWRGEILRSPAMYKMFPTTIYFTHIRRAMNEAQRVGGYQGLGYLADFMISTTLMGAFAMQTKEMAKGRDPRQMIGDKAPDFWGAAMLQGGGLGIFGDFFFSDVNRFGGSLAGTAAGPMFQAADDARKLTIGNAIELVQRKKTNAGRELVRFAGDYTPGNNLWYTRLATERAIFDRLDLWADPAAARAAHRRRQRAAKREFDTGYWWAPGQATPNRSPDLETIIED